MDERHAKLQSHSLQAASEWAGEAVGLSEMHLLLLLSNPITLLLPSSSLFSHKSFMDFSRELGLYIIYSNYVITAYLLGPQMKTLDLFAPWSIKHFLQHQCFQPLLTFTLTPSLISFCSSSDFLSSDSRLASEQFLIFSLKMIAMYSRSRYRNCLASFFSHFSLTWTWTVGEQIYSQFFWPHLLELTSSTSFYQ